MAASTNSIRIHRYDFRRGINLRINHFCKINDQYINLDPKIIWKRVIRLLVVCLALLNCFAVPHLHSQSRLELINADVTKGKTLQNNVEVKILQGNVHVRQDTVEIFCDTARYRPDQKKLVLTGNTKIRRGNELLTAEKVTYFTDKKMAIAENSVHLTNPGQQMFAEYLEYYYETDQAFARTNLLLIDEGSRIFVRAKEGEYIPQENRSKVERKAHLWQVDSTGTDTLHIYARRMDYFSDTTRKAIARDSVRIVRDNLVARCDSAVYFFNTEKAFLEINPKVTQTNNKMIGNSMELFFQEMVLQKIHVRGQALATSVIDSSDNKINRLAAQQIIAFINEGKIDRLWAIENARSVYYINEEEVSEGINSASADTIRIYFKKSEVDSIVVKGGSQGIYYPANYKGEKDLEF